MKTFATALALVSLCALSAILDEPDVAQDAGSTDSAERSAAPSRAGGGIDTACLDPWSVCVAEPVRSASLR